MVKKKRIYTHGGKRAARNRKTGRGGPTGKGPLDRLKRRKHRARVFRRDDSDGKKPRDISPKREKNKKPRPGRQPKDMPWGGRSRRNKNKIKKLWRDTPGASKMEKPTRDRRFSGRFPSPEHPDYKERRKIRGKRGNEDEPRDPTQSELEAAYESFEENERMRKIELKRTSLGIRKGLTDERVRQEILERDYKQFISSQKKNHIIHLRDDEDYKSSDELLDSDVEHYSSINFDNLKESEDDEGDGDEKEVYSIVKDEIPKLSKQSEGIKSSGRASITEPEWTDFLQKNVYENSEQEKTDTPIEIESKENIPVKEEKVEKSISNEEEKTVKNRMVALKNKWKWFRKLTKTMTLDKVILPKELLDEVNDEKPAEEDNNEVKGQLDEEQVGKCFDEILAAEKNQNKLNDSQFQLLKKIYMDTLSKQSSNIESSSVPSQILESDAASPFAQTLETAPTLSVQTTEFGTLSSSAQTLDTAATPSVQTIEVGTLSSSAQTLEAEPTPSVETMESESILSTIESGTESTHPQSSEAETKSDTTKLSELPKTSEGDTDSVRENMGTYIAEVFTDDVERLKDTWHRFLMCYEQATGVSDHDLPYDLPNEEDEIENTECEDEPENNNVPTLEPTPSPVLEKPEPTLVLKENVSGKLTSVENSEVKQTPSVPEGKDDFDGDPGFREMYDRKEDERERDINRLMYESYKITGSPTEFFEDHPELLKLKPDNLPTNRPALQWHHFKELWNRFVDDVTKYPGKAFEEYDKIIAAKDRAIKKGIDVTEELNLTSVPEEEEPMTEYQKTEAELRAAWKKYEKRAAIDPQQGLFETLVEQGELQPKPDDIVSPEAEETFRTVVRLLDHPERFNMDKYEASLSKEELESVQTGEGMKYDKRFNPNANNTMEEDAPKAANVQENSSSRIEQTPISQGYVKRSAMAQKMWEYFVNMMRERHEKELEKFLSQQPQGAVSLGNNPNDVKELWQKYINYTSSLQTPADGKGPEEIEYLWSPTSAHKPSRLEESKTHVPSTQGWTHLVEDLEGLQGKIKKPDAGSETFDSYGRNAMPQQLEHESESYLPSYASRPPPEQQPPAKRGWEVLAERMRKLSTYGTDGPENTRTLFEVGDKKEMEFFYEQQFPSSEVKQDYQHQQPNTDYQSSEGTPPPHHRPAPPPPRGENYNYGPYPVMREQPQQHQNPYPWQYNTEVNQMASTPFGQSRQTLNYDASPEQYGPGRRQAPWQRTNMYSRGYDQNIPRHPQDNRRYFDQGDPTPLDNQVSKTPVFQQRRPAPDMSYSQQIPLQNEQPWSSAQEQKTTKNWQSGSRPFLRQQDESLTQRRPNGEYHRPMVNQYDQPSRGLYNTNSKSEDCIHLSYQDELINHNLQRQNDTQTLETDHHPSSTYNPNISSPKDPDMNRLSSNTNP